ncbi:MAG: hypothetical protein ABI864_00050 [Chloroflexota bacterium]
MPVAAEVLSVPRQGLEPRQGDRKRVIVNASIQGALESGIKAAQEIHEAP